MTLFSPQFCTQDYGTSGRLAEVQAIAEKHIFQPSLSRPPASPSYTVITPKVLSKHWGLTGDEIRLASEAGHFLDGLDIQLWYAVIADKTKSEAEIRELSREFKNRLCLAQGRAGTRKYWLEMLESRPTVHSNLLFPFGGQRASRGIESLQRAKLFPGDTLDIQELDGSQSFVAYCSKERTPQASWLGGINMAGRIKGSHPLGDGGGDRVRLSKQLDADMHAAGCRIEPRRRVYASRALPKPARGLMPNEMQLVLFEEFNKPVTRLHDFAHGILTPSVALEVEFHRKRHGLTQSKLAQRAGISQPQLANVIAGRFGLAAWPTARLREVLLAA